jgi:hypothetical protein
MRFFRCQKRYIFSVCFRGRYWPFMMLQFDNQGLAS